MEKLGLNYYTRLSKDVHASMYSTDTSSQNAVISTYFHNNAVFEDPIVYVKGNTEVRRMFNSFTMLFSSVEPKIVSVMETEFYEDHILVFIEADITYRLPTILFRVPIELKTYTRYDWNADQKIVHHKDIWNLTDFIEKIPMLGPFYVHTVRNIVGFGLAQVVNLLR